MKRAFIFGAGLAAALSVAAHAQSTQALDAAKPAQPGASGPPVGATPSQPATAADFKAGDTVKDSEGAPLGSIVKAGAATNGQLAVVVNIDGKDVSLPGNLFTVADGVVTAQATKAQIQAAMAKG